MWPFSKTSSAKNSLPTGERDAIRTGVNYGRFVNRESMLRIAAVFSCVRVLSDAIPSLPLKFFEKTDAGRVPYASEIATMLRYSPNATQTAFEYWERVVIDLCRSGNHYSEIVGSAQRPSALIQIDSDRVTPQVKAGKLEYSCTREDGSQYKLPPEKMFHVRYKSLDGLVGLNPIEYHRETFGVAMAARDHGLNYFTNAASPSGVVETDQVLKDDVYNRIKDYWVSRYSSPANAGKVPILEAGLKFKPFEISNEDAQYIETRKFSRAEIAGIYGVPPHMIGDTERAKGWSTLEAQMTEFVALSLAPWLCRIEHGIIKTFVPRKQWGVVYPKFMTNSLERGDMSTRKDFYAAGIQNGWLCPNEVRELEDMNKRPGGDEFGRQANIEIESKSKPVKKSPMTGDDDA